ncbi:hypothetical protein GCM10022421_22910 [Oceanisphaera sediminis]|uniref:Uncharacterized protein n=1 Tax=Oceanisphaera sediminis TaxID=981381 RepID=A0ABP7E8A0_9GAMM
MKFANAQRRALAEMCQRIIDNHSGRTGADEIIIFDSVGFALEGDSVLCLLFDLAEQDDLGSFIKRVPELDDPRDLFSLTKDGKVATKLRKVA